MKVRPHRILAFTPYAVWRAHTNFETTFTRACELRGAEVKHLLCDGIFGECDASGSTSEPTGRTAAICRWCQSGARAAIEEAGLSYEWLSRYIRPEEKRAVVDWAQSLRPDELADSCFDGFPVGGCVRTSVVSYFRTFPIRTDDWQTINVFRGFVHGGALTYIAMNRALDEFQPEALVVFNGRLSMTRVALTIARKRGLRVLIHETPRTPGTAFVLENHNIVSAAPMKGFWKDWGNIPLTRPELDRVAGFLADRRYGRSGPGIMKFATSPEGVDSLRRRLDLRGKKLVALFTSSTDESAGDPDITPPFPSQEDWIERIVEWASRAPDCDLVVRVHPCLLGQNGIPKAQSQIDWFQRLAATAPANVKIVMPDDPLSSYDLMDAADVGLTYGSTAGIEMFALGKPVVAVPGYSVYADAGLQGLILTTDAASVDDQMNRALQLGPSREYQRAAFRYLYRYYFHMQMPFPYVSMVDTFTSRLNYSEDAALGAGADAALDRICGFLLEGTPIFPGPDAAALSISQENEDEFLGRIARDPAWLLNARSKSAPVPADAKPRRHPGTTLLGYSMRLLKRSIPAQVRDKLRHAAQSTSPGNGSSPAS